MRGVASGNMSTPEMGSNNSNVNNSQLDGLSLVIKLCGADSKMIIMWTS